MKKLIIVAALVAACHRAPPAPVSPARTPTASNQLGAADPASAVRAFLAAAKDQDLQAMSSVWGNATGSARDQMKRQDMEERELVMVKCLSHDSYQILAEAPATGGRRIVAVQLKRRELIQAANVTVIPGPRGRWFVEKVDIDKFGSYCGS